MSYQICIFCIFISPSLFHLSIHHMPPVLLSCVFLHITSCFIFFQHTQLYMHSTRFILYFSLVSHICNTALRSCQPIRSVMVLNMLLPWENNTLLQPDWAACHCRALREVRGHRACAHWCQEDIYNRTKLEYNERAEMIDDTARCTIYNTYGWRHYTTMTDHQMGENGNANRLWSHLTETMVI